MKKFEEPLVELIELAGIETSGEGDDVVSESPCDYTCPSMYGNACAQNHEYA